VEEFYQLADCYVFPLEIGSSLSMPLSVLEAMASNLPVVSVRFEGLASAFDEGKGLMFVDRPEDIVHRVHMLMDAQQIALTREQVTPYSWEAVADKLLGYYQELLNDDKID
jgi:glycosyltransferase involved in cell wall biosynthesis